MPSHESTIAKIQGLVRRLNDAWLERRFGELGTLFHPEHGGSVSQPIGHRGEGKRPRNA